MAEDQGIKGLKITNKRGIIYHPADRFAGVDHDPNINPDYDKELDEDYSNMDDDTAHTKPKTDIDSDEEYDQIDQEEINDLVADTEVEPANTAILINHQKWKPLRKTMTSQHHELSNPHLNQHRNRLNQPQFCANQLEPTEPNPTRGPTATITNKQAWCHPASSR